MYFRVMDLVHWLNFNLVFKMDTWAQSNKFSTASFSGCFFIAFVLRPKRTRPLQQRLCVWHFFHRQSFPFSGLSARVNSSLISSGKLLQDQFLSGDSQVSQYLGSLGASL